MALFGASIDRSRLAIDNPQATELSNPFALVSWTENDIFVRGKSTVVVYLPIVCGTSVFRKNRASYIRSARRTSHTVGTLFMSLRCYVFSHF